MSPIGQKRTLQRMNTQGKTLQVAAKAICWIGAWLFVLWFAHKRTLLPPDLVYTFTDFALIGCAVFMFAVSVVYLFQLVKRLRSNG